MEFFGMYGIDDVCGEIVYIDACGCQGNEYACAV